LLRLDFVAGPAMLEFNAAANKSYTIQYSDDLVTWTQLTDVPAGPAQMVHVPVILNQTARFYRLRTPQAP
jgi:hypothetical protein